MADALFGARGEWEGRKKGPGQVVRLLFLIHNVGEDAYILGCPPSQ